MKKLFPYFNFTLIIIGVLLLTTCKKDEETKDNCSLSDLSGRWDGYIDKIGNVNLTIDSHGNVSGDLSSEWSITNEGEITGEGSYSYISGSQLIVASAIWTLQLDIKTKSKIVKFKIVK